MPTAPLWPPAAIHVSSSELGQESLQGGEGPVLRKSYTALPEKSVANVSKYGDNLKKKKKKKLEPPVYTFSKTCVQRRQLQHNCL